MRKNFYLLIIAILLVSCNCNEKVISIDPTLPEAEYYVYVVADAGRNGAYDQTKIGEVMGVYANDIEPEFVLNCGDMFHYDGVESVDDPLFMTNYELIYKHGELHCPWYGVLGNHEYHGNTQAVIDYTNVSRRWNVPDRYYAKMFEGVNDKDSIFVLFTDTAPMIDKYHQEEGYPDARLQDPERQIKWIDSTLSSVKNARWKISIGHHPVYSYSKKSPKETAQMQERVAELYKKHSVDVNFSGHVHTFQHLQPTDAVTEYFVSPSASLHRTPKNGEFTKFNYDGTGFLILGFNEDSMTVSMINVEGKMVYSYVIE